MQRTITIDDTLLQNAAQCLAMEDVNQVISIALAELIQNHHVPVKRRQPPSSIAGKGKVLADLVAPVTDIGDFDCLK